MQQKNLDMVKLWHSLCREKDLNFDWRIIANDQSIEIYNFLQRKISARIYEHYTCLVKAMMTGDTKLAQTLTGKFRPLTMLVKIKYFWDKTNRLAVYQNTCEACIWGDLNSLKIMKEKGFFVHVTGDLALVCAHFMGYAEIERYLETLGCKLDKKTAYYMIAEACETSNMDGLRQALMLWKLKREKRLEDIVVKLMLMLSIKNRNIALLEFILSKCKLLSFGIMDVFEYAVELQTMPVIHMFLKKFNALAYYAVCRGSYLKKEQFVRDVSVFLCQDHRKAAYLKVYQYGMIFQNIGLISLAENVLKVNGRFV